MVNKQNQRSMPLIHFNNKGRNIHTYAPNNLDEPFFSVFAGWLIFCITETAMEKLLLRVVFQLFMVKKILQHLH